MRRLLNLALLMTLVVPAAHAQFESIDLNMAMDVALQNRPTLQAFDARIRAERARSLLGLGISGPMLLYEREGIPNARSGFGEQKVGLTQEIPEPLLLRAQLRARRSGLETMAANRAVAVAHIRESVKSAYIDVLYSRQLLALRGRAVELGYQLLRAVEARIEVGESAEIDLLKAQLQEAEARDLLDGAEREYHRSRYGLFRAMGLEPDDQQYSVIFADSLRFTDVIVDQDAVLGRIDLFPEVITATSALNTARLDEDAQRYRILPRPLAGYWWQDLGDGYRFHGFQLGIRMPISEWVTKGASRRMAEAERQATEAELLGITLDMKEDIERRWHSYDVSRRTLKRYEESLRGKGEMLVSLTREGYLLGELDLLTLLDAQRTYIAGRVRYLEALRNYHRDLVRLERYAGRELATFE